MIGQTVGGLLENKVTLEAEGIDRLYFNLYQPRLQTGGGVVQFLEEHRGAQVAATALMAPVWRDAVLVPCPLGRSGASRRRWWRKWTPGSTGSSTRRVYRT